jgi:hypothetical protein
MPARRLAVSAVLFAVVLNRVTPLEGQKFRLHKVLVALGLHRETIGFEFLSSVRISSISEFDFISYLEIVQQMLRNLLAAFGNKSSLSP